MTVAQSKMKGWFDKDAQSPSFRPGDNVLVLLPISGSSLQARYSGPYVVQEKVSECDYVVATPDHRRRNQLCHVNMLKPYLEQESVSTSPVVLKPVVAISGAEVIDQAEAAVELACTDLQESEDLDSQNDDVALSSAVVHGFLKNSELLANRDGCI